MLARQSTPAYIRKRDVEACVLDLGRTPRAHGKLDVKHHRTIPKSEIYIYIIYIIYEVCSQ